MKILLDTNILTRFTEPGHAMHSDSRDATRTLASQGHILCIVPQNLYEFWAVCTRPQASNGLGKTATEAAGELANIETLFTLLDDSPALLPWEQLVKVNAVLGRNARAGGSSLPCSCMASPIFSPSTTRTSDGFPESPS